ncbi:50S ribosomal protein L4 [Candidatus Fermentibacteria bacterium]|nr:50S ribosomal protein L4 [Candidatus Fermentibacteria bacterium]
MSTVAEARVYTMDGNEVGVTKLSDDVFGTAGKTHVLWEVVHAEQINARRGTASTKSRSEVWASGRKPWRQKHTGRARAGSVASPIWRGGGVTGGPSPKRWRLKVNRKLRRKALAGILSERLGEGNLRIIRDLSSEGKTREIADMLRAHECHGRRTVLLLGDDDDLVMRAARNIPHLRVHRAVDVPVSFLVEAEMVLISEPAVEKLSERCP